MDSTADCAIPAGAPNARCTWSFLHVTFTWRSNFPATPIMQARMAVLLARLSSGPAGMGARATSTIAALREVLRTELDGIRAAGTWKSERVIVSPQAASIRVQGRPGEILNFCANNYLGLSVN